MSRWLKVNGPEKGTKWWILPRPAKTVSKLFLPIYFKFFCMNVSYEDRCFIQERGKQLAIQSKILNLKLGVKYNLLWFFFLGFYGFGVLHLFWILNCRFKVIKQNCKQHMRILLRFLFLSCWSPKWIWLNPKECLNVNDLWFKFKWGDTFGRIQNLINANFHLIIWDTEKTSGWRGNTHF